MILRHMRPLGANGTASDINIELINHLRFGNGHIAPLILRCMTDAHITLAWILNDPQERAKKNTYFTV